MLAALSLTVPCCFGFYFPIKDGNLGVAQFCFEPPGDTILRGVLLNYRSRAVAREFLKTSFSGKPFWTVL